MGHYWSEVQDEYKATEKTVLKLLGVQPMTKQPKSDNQLGFTEVWKGKASEFIRVVKQWSMVEEDCQKVESSDGDLSLWVANEWIDWKHYRRTLAQEFRPANSANICNNRIEDRTLESHALLKMQKADEQKWQKQTPLSQASADDYYNK